MKSRNTNKAVKKTNWAAVLLVSAGLLLLLASAGLGWLENRFRHPGPVPLPEHLAGLSLARSATGARALQEINRLHGKDLPASSGAVGWYGPQPQLTLWVSGVPLEFLARRTLVEMRERIAEGRSPFLPRGTRQVDGRTVYELDGLGQKHFYFQAGKLVVWLAADAELAEQALRQALEFYP